MSEFLTVDVEVTGELIDKLEQLTKDPVLGLEMHNILRIKCDPYVPYLNGPLSMTAEVTPEYIEYVQPYAHRQYHGVDFNHTLDWHPLASAEWDKAMLRDHRVEFQQDIREALVRRYNELYGQH